GERGDREYAGQHADGRPRGDSDETRARRLRRDVLRHVRVGAAAGGPIRKHGPQSVPWPGRCEPRYGFVPRLPAGRTASPAIACRKLKRGGSDDSATGISRGCLTAEGVRRRRRRTIDDHVGSADYLLDYHWHGLRWKRWTRTDGERAKLRGKSTVWTRTDSLGR